MVYTNVQNPEVDVNNVAKLSRVIKIILDLGFRQKINIRRWTLALTSYT